MSSWQRYNIRFGLGFGLLLSSLMRVCAAEQPARVFPDVSALNAQAPLPDPLVMFDGRAVTSQKQWFDERRPELKAFFEHYMYGAIPPKAGPLKAVVVGEYGDFLGGKAVLKLVQLETGPGKAPKVDLMLVLPRKPATPPPVFLAMNFCGNQALTTDPRVPLTRSWLLGSMCSGCISNTATEAARGSQAADWPLEQIVRRGYALASFCSGDIDPDRADRSTGIYAWLAGGDSAKNEAANRGTIAAWAWGFERCVDYLVTETNIDGRRIAAVGHSRNGKTALLAAAFDERIAMAFPHQAGCGGTAPSRGKTGESVKAINDSFPHWFNAVFKQFNAAPERLPFDQNCLLALCAPRPVLFSAAQEDQWSNPSGQFEVAQAAESAYRLLGVEGLGNARMPELRQLVGGRVGYYIREGKHSMTPDDWKVFMDFTDRQWGKAESVSGAKP
jgi:hypothetical protein